MGSGATTDQPPTASTGSGNAAPKVGKGILGTGVTYQEASAAATGVSALYTLAQSKHGISIPPAPRSVQNDSQVQLQEQQILQREQSAGGLDSTTGTAGGEQGAILGAGTTSNRSILGG